MLGFSVAHVASCSLETRRSLFAGERIGEDYAKCEIMAGGHGGML
jgi:hypothetical protein